MEGRPRGEGQEKPDGKHRRIPMERPINLKESGRERERGNYSQKKPSQKRFSHNMHVLLCSYMNVFTFMH